MTAQETACLQSARVPSEPAVNPLAHPMHHQQDCSWSLNTKMAKHLQPEVPQALFPTPSPHTHSFRIKWPGAHRTHPVNSGLTWSQAAGVRPAGQVAAAASVQGRHGPGGSPRPRCPWGTSFPGQAPAGLHGTPGATEVRVDPVLGVKHVLL